LIKIYPLALVGGYLMSQVTPPQNLQTTDKTDWLLISEAALRVSNFSSLDDLLHHALNCWLQQVAPELRWKIAIDLYTTEQISSGRAAEIAGLNYFVFEQKLRESGIPFIEAESTTEAEKEQQRALIDELFDFPKA
jgi:predicted HTH domain antitoxin